MIDNNSKELQTFDDDACDLNPEKICNSCGDCLGLNNNDFKVVRIDGLAPGEIELEDYILEDNTLGSSEGSKEDDDIDIEYIEDIPELKKKYDKEINEILGRE